MSMFDLWAFGNDLYAQGEAYMAQAEGLCPHMQDHESHTDGFQIDGQCSVVDVKRLEGKS